jgi:hypothetical protein
VGLVELGPEIAENLNYSLNYQVASLCRVVLERQSIAQLVDSLVLSKDFIYFLVERY